MGFYVDIDICLKDKKLHSVLSTQSSLEQYHLFYLFQKKIIHNIGYPEYPDKFSLILTLRREFFHESYMENYQIKSNK